MTDNVLLTTRAGADAIAIASAASALTDSAAAETARDQTLAALAGAETTPFATYALAAAAGLANNKVAFILADEGTDGQGATTYRISDGTSLGSPIAVNPNYLSDIAALRLTARAVPITLDDGSVWTTDGTTGHAGGEDDGILNIVDSSARLWERVHTGGLTPELFGAATDASTATNDAAFAAMSTYCVPRGIKMTGNFKTYALTSWDPDVSAGALHLRDITLDFSAATGVDVRPFSIDAGDLEASIVVTTNVARLDVSVEVSGGTKPVAGGLYWLISDANGTYDATAVCTKSQMVRVSPEYDGSSATVPLVWETHTTYTTADNARLRRVPDHASVDVAGVSLIGPSDSVSATGLELRNLDRPKVELTTGDDFANRGVLAIGVYCGDVVVSDISNAVTTGTAYAIATSGCYGGTYLVKHAERIGVCYTDGPGSNSSELLSSRFVDFQRTQGFGVERSIIDCHPGSFDVRYGGCSGVTATFQASTNDMFVFSGSRVTVYGDIEVAGSGHRHGINIQLTGCTDVAGEGDYVKLQNVSINAVTYLIAASCPLNPEVVDVSFDTIKGSSGAGVLWQADTGGGFRINGRYVHSTATAGRAWYQFTTGSGAGQIYANIATLIALGTYDTVDVNGIAYETAHTGVNGAFLIALGGEITRTDNAANRAVLTQKGNALFGPAVLMDINGTFGTGAGATNHRVDSTSA